MSEKPEPMEEEMKVNGVKNTPCKCKNPMWSSTSRQDGKGRILACSSCGHKWLKGDKSEQQQAG